MPLFLHKYLQPTGEIGIWKIQEEESFFIERLALGEQEASQLAAIKGEGRRLEWLAARKLVHVMSGRSERGAFLKDQYGKPYLADSLYHISISHSHGYAAAIAAPCPVGVDIQLQVPKIERIAHKYLRSEEMDSIGGANRIAHLHAYWGAKEALYKAYGRRELDFCKHILIDPFSFDVNGDTVQGRVWKGDFDEHYQIKYEMLGKYILVYARQEGRPETGSGRI